MLIKSDMPLTVIDFHRRGRIGYYTFVLFKPLRLRAQR